jgi:signal transduction histidine kinase
VRLVFAPELLEIEVTDNGSCPPSTVDGGTGLRGLAERVGMCGGRLDAGPVESGGFRVHAVLPAEPVGAVR